MSDLIWYPDCRIVNESSRVCERGFLGCIVKHFNMDAFTRQQQRIAKLAADVKRMKEQQPEDTLDVCPNCHKTTVKTKWNGLECTNPDCDYWFCL